jgi:hypothetical protein
LALHEAHVELGIRDPREVHAPRRELGHVLERDEAGSPHDRELSLVDVLRFVEHPGIGGERSGNHVDDHARFLHRPEDLGVVGPELDHGRDPLADSGGHHGTAQHGASRSHDGGSSEGDDLVETHVPDEDYVVIHGG